MFDVVHKRLGGLKGGLALCRFPAFLRAVTRSSLETVLAVSAGVALSTSLGYLAYAAPGDAVPLLVWLTSPSQFSTLLWAVLGALFGLCALQFRRGRRFVDRNTRQGTRTSGNDRKSAGEGLVQSNSRIPFRRDGL
ncbi:hypothetical protein MPL3356_110140 [Mesorhizobium plurifarium]|uniref:Uncharacterized protein n=1 Tax=Mesorhizobium plurifarium TaxID=69974 RepID=A0A090D9T5_MESPL|nr:hypothetical protein MPL3356_110140 [Mesorhizobium plurifarium]